MIRLGDGVCGVPVDKWMVVETAEEANDWQVCPQMNSDPFFFLFFFFSQQAVVKQIEEGCYEVRIEMSTVISDFYQ